jgi:dTMP kinase
MIGWLGACRLPLPVWLDHTFRIKMHGEDRAMKHTGVFIALDGVDGGGKTGAIAFLKEALSSAGYDLLVTREPGGTEEGQALRQLLLANDTFDWEPMAELLLINAARVPHVGKVIRPAIEEGKIVLCDRFVASTIAYQGAGRGIPVEQILELHRISVGDLWPDLTVILDVDPRKGIDRSRKRLQTNQVNEGRFEKLDLAFHQRVRKSFLDQAAMDSNRYAVIDADRPPLNVQQEVLQRVLHEVEAKRR